MSQNAGLVLEIDGFKEFRDAMRELEKAARDLDRHLNGIDNTVMQYDRHMQRYARNAAQARREIGQGAGQTAREVDSASQKQRRAMDALKRATDSAATGMGRSFDRIVAGARGMSQQVRSLLGQASAQMQQVGTGVMAAGAIGLGAAAGGGAFVAQPALEYQNAMVNANSVTGESLSQTRELNDEILRMGAASRQGPQATAEAYYQIVSGVQDANSHIAILNASIGLSESGQAELTTATAGMISVMNAYDLQMQDAALVSDVFAQMTAQGTGTLDEFVSTLGPAAGLAYDLKIDLEELAAAQAYLTSTGAGASEAETQLTAAMSAFLKPNTQMREALQRQGFATGTAAIEALGLQGAVQGLYDTLGSTDAVAQALGSQEALGAAIALNTDRADEFINTFIEEIPGATERARAIQEEGWGDEIDRARSAADALRIVIGLELLPILGRFAGRIADVATELIVWVQENPELVRSIGLIVGAVTAFIGVLVPLGAMIATVGFTLGALATPMSVVGGLLFSPLGVIAGLTALGTAALVASGRGQAALAWLQGMVGPMREMAAMVGLLPGGDEATNDALADRVRIMEDLEAAQADVAAQASDLTRTVEAGDTYWDLAREYGVDLDTLRAANADNPNLVLGTEIVIPGAGEMQSEFDTQVESLQKELDINTRMLVAGVDVDLDANDMDPAMIEALTGTLNDRIVTPLAPVTTFFQTTWQNDIKPGLVELGDGIDGFSTRVGGADWQGAAETIGWLVGAVIKVGAVVFQVGAFGVAETLPVVGDAIALFINGLGAFSDGRWGEGLASIANGLYRLGLATTVFQLGLLKGIATQIGEMFEIDVAPITERIDAVIAGLLRLPQFIRHELPIRVQLAFVQLRLSIATEFNLMIQEIQDLVEGLNILPDRVLDRFDFIPNAEDLEGIKIDTTQLEANVESLEVDLEAAREIGVNVNAGVAEGLRDTTEAEAAALESANAVKGRIEEAWGINSPAEEAKPIGAAIVDGVALGMTGNQAAMDDAVGLFNGNFSAMDAEVQRATTAIIGYLVGMYTNFVIYIALFSAQLPALQAWAGAASAEFERVATAAERAANQINAAVNAAQAANAARDAGLNLPRFWTGTLPRRLARGSFIAGDAPPGAPGRGYPEIVTTNTAMAVLNTDTTMAYMAGVQAGRGGNLPAFNQGGVFTPSATPGAALGTVVNSTTVIDNSRSVNVNVIASPGMSEDGLVNKVVRRVKGVLEQDQRLNSQGYRQARRGL